MSAQDATPSPVRQVKSFEADERLAEKLQQEFDDEARAAEMDQSERIHAAFDDATRQVEEERTAKALERLA